MQVPDFNYTETQLRIRAFVVFLLTIFLFFATGTEIMDVAKVYLEEDLGRRPALLIVAFAYGLVIMVFNVASEDDRFFLMGLLVGVLVLLPRITLCLSHCSLPKQTSFHHLNLHHLYLEIRKISYNLLHSLWPAHSFFMLLFIQPLLIIGINAEKQGVKAKLSSF